MNPVVRIGFRNALVNWKRNASVCTSIALGFFVVSSFLGYVDDVKKMFRQTYQERSMIGDAFLEPIAKESEANSELIPARLVPGIVREVKRHLGLESEIVRFREFTGELETLDRSVYFQGLGYDLKSGVKLRGERYSWNTLAGKPLEESSSDSLILAQKLAPHIGCFSQLDGEVFLNGVLGYPRVARPFACESNEVQVQVVTDSGQMNAETLQVAGLIATGFEQHDTQRIYTSLKNAHSLVDSEDLTYLTVQVSDDMDHAKSLSRFEHYLLNEGRNFNIKLTRWKEHSSADLYVRTVNWLLIFQILVVSIVVVVSALSLSSTTLRLLKKRMKEVGTMRAIGYTPRQVLSVFLVEGFAMTVAGICLGVLLSALLSVSLSEAPFAYKAGFLSDPVPFRVAFHFDNLVWAAWTMTCVSLASVYLSVRSGVNQKISDCFLAS